MKWFEGHIWRIVFQRVEIGDNFEFKFVIKEGNQVVRWEEGFNHSFDIKRFNDILRQPSVLKEIEHSKYDVVEVATDKEKIGFDRK